jgi:hypothetical protein
MQRMLLFLSVFAAFLPAQEQPCRVEGQVLSVAGAPLKKTTLRLQWNGQSNQSATPTGYVTTSDNDGKFLFDEVAPGTYILSAQRTAYVNQTYGAKSPGTGMTPLKLDAGQVMKDLVFKSSRRESFSAKWWTTMASRCQVFRCRPRAGRFRMARNSSRCQAIAVLKRMARSFWVAFARVGIT